MICLLGGLLLVGCAAPPEITPVAPPPTPAVVAGAGANGAQAPPVQAASDRFPMIPPSQESIAGTDSSNCIACHTNQEALQELAVEPEETESLSEGEG